MTPRKMINHTEAKEWEKLNEVLRRRPGPGTPLFEPHELGYACPVCDASDEVNLTWSEFNGMIWCHNCKEDWPSCICKAYPEPKISHRKLTKFQKARENKRVFVATIQDFKKEKQKEKIEIKPIEGTEQYISLELGGIKKRKKGLEDFL